jgi:hypothetical protein
MYQFIQRMSAFGREHVYGILPESRRMGFVNMIQSNVDP